MFPLKYPVPQTEPPRSPRETLPTMYDLPSENPEEPGKPDEFHGLQPQLLSYTFRPSSYSASQIFTGSDMNLYYDVRHPLWYKRPDWFGVVGVSRLYDEVDMRLSYVIWQEGVNPFVIVELLSPGTEKEDLGENDEEKLPPASEEIAGNGNINREQSQEKPLRKWEVYEQILRIPYYVVFSRYTNRLRAFKLKGARYEELELSDSRVGMPEIDLGLGLWQGDYLGVDRLWLRWYDSEGNWIPTPEERAIQAQKRAIQAQELAEQERQRAETAEARLEFLRQKLRESGIDPDRFLNS
ncbi:Uma2 family endonuclease [Microcoleus sp. ARI1-B5]|uniref:Uma2 family endonuclease n=1 Tax=unclassified Microcoleus TaxID=2642155 RepID=UPI002FD1648A